jgi:prepilin-type processing-associated H-X9-DG protein
MKPSRRNKAFSMIDLLLIIAVVVGLVFVILPQIAKNRAKTSRIGCTNNLKQIALSFRIWAGDNNDEFPMNVSVTNGGTMEFALRGSIYESFLVMSNELSTPKILVCPEESNSKRRAASIFASAVPPGSPARIVPFTPTNNLSYFVGLDATQTNAQTILAGDDNLMLGKIRARPGLWLLPTNTPPAWSKERHVNRGNIAFADGSVQGFTTAGLAAALSNTGISTNRLAMPY